MGHFDHVAPGGADPGVGELSESFWGGTGLFVVIGFLAFFIGFAGGRRRGKREGFAEGLAYAPLEMRRQTWENGHCVVCGTTFGEGESVSDGRCDESFSQFQH